MAGGSYASLWEAVMGGSYGKEAFMPPCLYPAFATLFYGYTKPSQAFSSSSLCLHGFFLLSPQTPSGLSLGTSSPFRPSPWAPYAFMDFPLVI